MRARSLFRSAINTYKHQWFSIKKCFNQWRSMQHKQVRFYNFWDQPADNIFFNQFIRSRNLIDNDSDIKINFYSVFGPPSMVRLMRGDIKVFFTGENLEVGFYNQYADYSISRGIDLALGFEIKSELNYMRFPLWILFMFPPASSNQDIKEFCAKLSFSEGIVRQKFACLVASHDKNGIRTQILDGINTILPVDSGGALRNNTSDLRVLHKNNKRRFLEQYNFNICPENSDSPGYVTEKLFQAIQAGCIPIYWGSSQNPEPDVLNHDAILFWEQGTDNSKVIHQIQDLVEHPNRLREFMQQPRLKPHAAEYISDMYDSLESKLRNLIIEKRKEKKHVKYKQLFFVY